MSADLTEAVKAFLKALDLKRQINPHLHGGASIEVVHSSQCYTESGPCICGGFDQKWAVTQALEVVRAMVAAHPLQGDPYRTIKHTDGGTVLL